MNEEQQQPTSQKPHWRFSQASTIAGSFCHIKKKGKKITKVHLKNDYRSVIDITFLSDIVSHLVAI